MGFDVRILVTGANGMLGRDLVPALTAAGHEAAGATRAAFDVTDRDETLRAIGEAAPDLVVHAAAYTRVDDAEREPERAFAVNHGGTRNVADACGARGAKLVYVSTDYVFDGTARAPYRETDPTNPISVYGRSKWMGEREVERLGNDGLIVRTSWLYGPHGPELRRGDPSAGRGKGTAHGRQRPGRGPDVRGGPGGGDRRSRGPGGGREGTLLRRRIVHLV